MIPAADQPTAPATRIKICGITSPLDARACHRLGADYLGVILAASPRQVTRETAAAIRRAVPDACLVGVFVDADEDAVAGTAAACMLDMIQLHGMESPAYCAALEKRTGLPVIKALRLRDLTGESSLPAYKAVHAVLLDLNKQESEGDAGRHRLWDAAERAREEGVRLLLAGGLDPQNVRAAVERAAPFGVDVCSGVERTPGTKNLRRVAQFIAEVRACMPVRP